MKRRDFLKLVAVLPKPEPEGLVLEDSCVPEMATGRDIDFDCEPCEIEFGSFGSVRFLQS